MQKTKAIQTLLIAGNTWEIRKLTPRLNDKFMKELKGDRERCMLRGYCDGREKKIYIRPGQHPEDFLTTLLHEGIHAILIEKGLQMDIPDMNQDERAVDTFTTEILGFLKQTGVVSA